MGIFSSIKNAIWGEDEKKTGMDAAVETAKATVTKAKAKVDAQNTPITRDELEARIAAKPGAEKLNWKTSIADLMRVLGLDPSYENRKELAHDVGIDDYSGTAEQNIHLHKVVMQKLAISGGHVPKDMQE